MKYYVGITDLQWFQYLSKRNDDEVNFWRPRLKTNWGPISEGAPFLFKLKSPKNYIVGGGYFVKHLVFPLSLVWSAFEQKNGSESREQFIESISRLRNDEDDLLSQDPRIGCTILSQPFFWPEEQWILTPSQWPMSAVQGKTLDSEDGAMGQKLWNQVQLKLSGGLVNSSSSPESSAAIEQRERYGVPQLVKPRLGQGGFRMVVTEAYHRKCAITGEKTLPVLEAAHIKPYSKDGPHAVNNGLLLRSDLHTLFDQGYVGIDEDYKVKVSSKIREEFENGRDYYAHQGQKLLIIPEGTIEQPSREYLEWHLKERFLA